MKVVQSSDRCDMHIFIYPTFTAFLGHMATTMATSAKI